MERRRATQSGERLDKKGFRRRKHVQDGRKSERTVEEPRVGNHEIWERDGLFCGPENVDVEGPGTPTLDAFAAASVFDRPREVEKIEEGQGGLEPGGGVEEEGLGRPEGRRLVDP